MHAGGLRGPAHPGLPARPDRRRRGATGTGSGAPGASRAMNAGRWRRSALTAIGAILLLLTGVGLWRQHVYDTDGFTILALVQGAFYLGAVALVWRGGLSRRAFILVLAVAGLMRLAVLLAPPYLSD